MKLQEGKHNHNLTNLLKVCLFGLVMILPFLAILPSTLYFAFNEHAQNYTHEEVITTYEYETNEVNSVDDLIVGNIYKFTLNNTDISNITNCSITATQMYYIEYNNTLTSTSMNNLGLAFYTVNNNHRFMVSNIDNNAGTYYGVRNIDTEYLITCNFYFVYASNYNYQNTEISYISASDYLGEKSVEIVSSEQSPLNAFNTASNNVWNMPIFNWVNNGLGSIAIANMLSVFGIAQNTFISNILIYWLSITAIYIIIDIVITAFTILTHLLTKKAE